MKLLSCYHLQSLTNRSRLMLKPALLSCIEAEEVFFRRQFIKHALKCSDEDANVALWLAELYGNMIVD